MKRKITVSVVGVAILVSSSALFAVERFVPSEYATIQAAIDDCNDGDVVIMEPNTYTGPGNRDLDFGSKAITVRSTDPNDPCVVAATVIDCNGTKDDPHRGFYFHSGEGPNSIVAGITIMNGYGRTEYIRGWYSAPVPAPVGGGICCLGASPTIKNCRIIGNTAFRDYYNSHGGGVYCESSSSPRIVDCSISDNLAEGGFSHTGGGVAYGGGICAGPGSIPEIENCIITHNVAVGGVGWIECGSAHGGGIFGQVAITNSRISGNSAFGISSRKGFGSAIRCLTGSSIVNCLIVSNELGAPESEGLGAIYGAGMTITNCTISNNMGIGWATTHAGIYKGSGTWPPVIPEEGATIINNCILWGNEGEDLYDCSATYSCIEDGDAGVGNISADPCFVSGPEGDHYLSQIAAGQVVDSPCVDAGSGLAANLGMDDCTTRTDGMSDEGTVDMGFHYGSCCLEPGTAADIDRDGDVDFDDYSWFAMGWYYGTPNQIPIGIVTVDGNLSEWNGDVEWRELDKVYYGSPNDVGEGRFALQWDPNTNKIYAAVIVDDSDHVFLDEYVSWDASDRLEIYSQGDAEGGTGWVGVYDVAQQYYVAPNTTVGSWGTWAFGETLGGDVGLEYAVVVNGDEIVYEVGVRAFDNYGGFSGGDTIVTELEVGHVVGFDVVVCTRRSNGFGMLSENLMTGKSGDAEQFARYVLVEKIAQADLDGNGVFDFADLDILVDSWLWEE